MVSLSYKNDQEEDERLNPSLMSAQNLQKLEGETGKNAGIDQLESFANDPKNTSRNIDAVSERENSNTTPNLMNYKNEGSAKKQKFTAKGMFKKKGAVGGLIALILGGLGGLTMLFTPGLAAVQLKEMLTDDLNDQLTAMDMRTTYVFKAKFNDMGRGVCKGVKVNCGFKGMSDRQLKKFRNVPGIEVETAEPPNDKTAFGKNRVVSMTFTDSNGNKIKIDNPSKLNQYLGDRLVRESLRKAFNPKFAGFFDAKRDAVYKKLGISNADKLEGVTDEKSAREKVDSAVAGETGTVDTVRAPTDDPEDEEKNKENAGTNDSATKQAGSISSGGESTSSLFSSVAKNGFKSAIKGLFITGAVDTACTVKNTGRAVEALSKVKRGLQLARFAMIYLTFADMVKAGEAKPAQAEYIGNSLTAVDTDKMIYDETSTQNADGSIDEVPNPDYGKSALDSDGYKVAAYNDAPVLSAQSMQYTVGGSALMGTLAGVNNFIETKLAGNKCELVQNNIVRFGSLLVGIGVGAVTLGASLAIQTGASIAIGMALPLLENYIATIVAGKAISSSAQNVEVGDGIFAGTAAIMGSMAMSRGMKPAKVSELKTYQAMTDKVQAEYIAAETEEAKATPFDIYNQYSFLGSLARTMLPVTSSLKSTTVVSSLANITNIIPIVSQSITKTAGAESEFNADRFEKCNDFGYEELGIDADIFCNVRYVMSPYELGLDTDEVREWMRSHGYVSDGGTPKDDYADWLEECTQREAGWGETLNEEDKKTGKNCMDDISKYSNKTMSYFRVYTMDDSIIEAMDYEPPVLPAATGAGSDFSIASFNILHSASEPASVWKARLQRSLNVLKTGGKDGTPIAVAGLQEVRPNQMVEFQKPTVGGTIYGMYPSSSKQPAYTPNPIIWDKSRFDLVAKAGMPFKYFGGSNDIAPQVRLRDKSSGQEFYVINVHHPADANGEADFLRKQDADSNAIYIKNLAKQGLPIFFTGDFNSGYSLRSGRNNTYGNVRSNMTYCILTREGVGLWDAYDASLAYGATGAKRAAYQKECPSEKAGDKGGNTVDHIFLSNTVDVAAYRVAAKGRNNNGADHMTIIADIAIASSTSESETGSDIVGDDYAKECGKYTTCTKQCVDFVKFRLLKHKVSKYKGGRLGDGGYVVGTLESLGYEVGTTPKVHSVMSTFATSDTSVGHTAMVSQVNPDGSIIVEEYNYANKLAYGKRLISKEEIKAKKMTFAYTGVDYK